MSEKLEANYDERNQKKRDLTTCVASRWYRSPEVIILDENYGQSNDIWGLGCILADIILNSNKEKSSSKEKT